MEQMKYVAALVGILVLVGVPLFLLGNLERTGGIEIAIMVVLWVLAAVGAISRTRFARDFRNQRQG
jgi:hypothetical protein